jgi:hypothetical protein
MNPEFQADPLKPWNVDLSDQHRVIQERVQGSISEIASGESIPPHAVVGPYGSGKTQFLYEAYRLSWEQNIPALYTDLKGLLDEFQRQDDISSLSEWIHHKISEQRETLIEGEEPEWIPDFKTTEDREQFFSENVSIEDIDSDFTVLLIDEIEQSYTKLDEEIGTDDDNPLRVILDKLTNVFQIWSFGLVSAYEVLGEADIRRFREIRIPILDVDEVWEHLDQSDAPTVMANGIWWLARGRAGWVNKYSDDIWQDESEIQSWINIVSRYEYYGAKALNEDVWSDIPGGNLTDAKRTVIFGYPDYSSWIRTGNSVMSVEDIHSFFLDKIREHLSIEGEVFDIVDRNLSNILKSLSPPSNWDKSEEEVNKSSMYLPRVTFSREPQMEGLINLLKDFISSFERRGGNRDDAIQLLNEIDLSLLTDQWLDLQFETKEREEQTQWTVNPEIVREAYPPIAVDPEVLTDLTSEELRDSKTEPVDINLKLNFEGGTITVRLCPTEDSFGAAINKSTKSKNITNSTLLLVPDSDESQEWDIPDKAERLLNLNLLNIEYAGGKRLWDFILQIDEYLKDRDYSQPYSFDYINDAKEHDEIDQRRNVIDALSNELERIGKNAGEETRDRFINSYTLTGSDYPIWHDESLKGRVPFYAKTGSGDISRIGITYGLVFSKKSANEDNDYIQMVDALLEGYNKEYIDQGKFSHTYFLRQAIDTDSQQLDELVTNQRRKFGTETGGMSNVARRLQRALGLISTSNGDSPIELYEKLTNTDTSVEEIPVLSESNFEYRQSDALIWGLLLDWVIENLDGVVQEELETVRRNVSRLIGRLEDVNNEIYITNERLEPPAVISIDDRIRIKSEYIDDLADNFRSVKNGIDRLIDKIDSYPLLASTGVVFLMVCEKYVELVKEPVENIENILIDEEVMVNIEDLKSNYADVHKWIQDTNTISGKSSKGRDDILESFEELGQVLFDFDLGGQEIPIHDFEAISELNNDLETEKRKLDILLDQIQDIDKAYAHHDDLKRDIDQGLSKLSEKLQDEGIEQ